MTIADLNNVELLQNATVQSDLLVLELGQNSLANVQAEHVEQFLLRDNIALKPFQRVLHLAYIISILEESAHGLFTCRY